jgi:dimethylglycine catabolism A
VHVSASHYRWPPSAERLIPPFAYPEGCFVPHAAHIRSEIAVPVIAVGRLGDPALAEPHWPRAVPISSRSAGR